MSFYWKGVIPSSKSVINRLLILQSFQPEIEIDGFSNCDDVIHMSSALKSFACGENVFNCGEAAAVLRFLAFRVSRKPGEYRLKGADSLMRRPHQDLIHILKQLGVASSLNSQEFWIHSNGWKMDFRAVTVPRETSSQFLSGVLLSSWDLEQDLILETTGQEVSENYFSMTQKILADFSLQMVNSDKRILVPRGQRLRPRNYSCELDMSSAFAIAAAAALCGEAEIQSHQRLDLDILQPDFQFVSILKKMGAIVELAPHTLLVRKKALLPVDVDLKDCPDLFPVLAILCAFASGESRLHGAPHLRHKESDRILGVSDLLTQMKIQHEVLEDGMLIKGNPELRVPQNILFDERQDHRLAMAAGVAALRAGTIRIQNPNVVAKSFPEFWDFIGAKQ